MNFSYNPTPVYGPNGVVGVTLLKGNGTRTYTNRFGSSFTTVVSIAAASTLGGDNVLYLNSQFPVDNLGITWNLSTPTQQPGQGPSTLYSLINIMNQSGIVVESGVSRIDGLGSAFQSTVPGFTGVTIGASNINALAAQYTTCSAPITFTNGLRAPTQPSASNGAEQFTYSYSISDGVTYTVQGNLTITCSSQFASTKDQLGNPYQVVIGITGTRVYTYIPSGTQIMSVVTGLSNSANPNADQRFYPYTLLGAAPGVYSVNTAPYFDSNGVEFGINPPAPVNGIAPGFGTQFSATTLYMSTPEPTAVLTEGYYVSLPLVNYQQQVYTL